MNMHATKMAPSHSGFMQKATNMAKIHPPSEIPANPTPQYDAGQPYSTSRSMTVATSTAEDITSRSIMNLRIFHIMETLVGGGTSSNHDASSTSFSCSAF